MTLKLKNRKLGISPTTKISTQKNVMKIIIDSEASLTTLGHPQLQKTPPTKKDLF